MKHIKHYNCSLKRSLHYLSDLVDINSYKEMNSIDEEVNYLFSEYRTKRFLGYETKKIFHKVVFFVKWNKI